ncbi:hypothetical protein PsYK624_130650 [Phanerochaete sordida]|uniref:Uncharacterized protein n=1 Tax=Phanerochaete sordida TaxID=48140 RepID=A0A9P3GJ45_9APHY|nr:hypothetical protein PsYK624_130650 [Phanerochaete sordida]
MPDPDVQVIFKWTTAFVRLATVKARVRLTQLSRRPKYEAIHASDKLEHRETIPLRQKLPRVNPTASTVPSNIYRQARYSTQTPQHSAFPSPPHPRRLNHTNTSPTLLLHRPATRSPSRCARSRAVRPGLSAMLPPAENVVAACSGARRGTELPGRRTPFLKDLEGVGARRMRVFTMPNPTRPRSPGMVSAQREKRVKQATGAPKE